MNQSHYYGFTCLYYPLYGYRLLVDVTLYAVNPLKARLTLLSLRQHLVRIYLSVLHKSYGLCFSEGSFTQIKLTAESAICFRSLNLLRGERTQAGEAHDTEEAERFWKVFKCYDSLLSETNSWQTIKIGKRSLNILRAQQRNLKPSLDVLLTPVNTVTKSTLCCTCRIGKCEI